MGVKMGEEGVLIRLEGRGMSNSESMKVSLFRKNETICIWLRSIKPNHLLRN